MTTDIVERLRAVAADAINPKGKIMDDWDRIRHQVETLKGSDLPRLNFEQLMEDFSERLTEAAERLREFEALVKHYQSRLRTIAKHPDTPELIRQYAVGLLDNDGMPTP